MHNMYGTCTLWMYALTISAVCSIVFFSAVFFSFAHTFAFSQSAKSVPLVPLILFLFNRNSIGGTYYFRDMCAYILHQTNINHTNSNTSTNINTIHGEPFVIFPRSVVVGTMPTISHPIPSMLFEHLKCHRLSSLDPLSLWWWKRRRTRKQQHEGKNQQK